MEKTIRRRRNNVILNHALKCGNIAGMNELEIFERLVHFLLDMNDEAMQEKLDTLMNSPLPLDMLEENNNKEL